MQERKLYEVVYTDDLYIQEISMVEKPAIKEFWVKLSEENNKESHYNEMEQLVTAPILIPDMKIERELPSGERIDMVFRKDVIKKLAEGLMEKGNTKSANIEHSDKKVDAFLNYIWIKDDAEKDKSNALGFNLPVGTLFGSYKVKDKKFWDEQVMTGKVKGFSGEMITDLIEVKLSELQQAEPEVDFSDVSEEELEALLDQLDHVLEKLSKK